MSRQAGAAIMAACGATVPVNVRWDTFGMMGQDDASMILNSRLKFLTDALAEVCADDAMKASFAEHVSAITLTQAGGAPDPMIDLNEGTLFIEYYWVIVGAPPSTETVRNDILARLRGEEMKAP